jgi:putative ABC transport system substrate-binding protein
LRRTLKGLCVFLSFRQNYFVVADQTAGYAKFPLAGIPYGRPLTLAARAQQPGKLPTIGFLGGATWESEWAATFVRRLHELGWTEGRTVAIEYRWTEGRNERAAEIAAEFVRLKVDVIVTYSSPPTLAAKQATSAIPIVFAAAGDPVRAGLVASLAGKRIELLREVVPGLRRLAILGNVSNPYVGK